MPFNPASSFYPNSSRELRRLQDRPPARIWSQAFGTQLVATNAGSLSQAFTVPIKYRGPIRPSLRHSSTAARILDLLQSLRLWGAFGQQPCQECTVCAFNSLE